VESDPSRSRRSSWPALPRGRRIYCVGDIHGRLDLLDGVPAVFLKGNHESVLIDFLWQPLVLPFWKSMGGYPTLLSYGLVPPLQPTERDCFGLADALQGAMPDTHRAFFEGLRSSHQEGDYLFAHAGINPTRPLDAQDERDLLWIRDAFLSSTRRFDKFVVHGHTPVKEPDIRSNRVNIDTGAYATGQLTCLVLEEDARRFL
jgi:serine/threonine protein phosphatase 1